MVEFADRTNPQHMYELKNGDSSDMVVCNLYPFEKLFQVYTEKDAIENIDISGPTMIRAAAKNFESVYVLTSPIEYEYFIKKMELFDDEDELLNLRKNLATSAFNHVTHYDAVISEYFNNIIGGEKDKLLIKNTERRVIYMDLILNRNQHLFIHLYHIVLLHLQFFLDTRVY